MKRMMRFLGWIWLPTSWMRRGYFDWDATKACWEQGLLEWRLGRFELRRIDSSGRDVTELPGLWDESDTRVGVRRRGFTLVELLVTLAFLAVVLAAFSAVWQDPIAFLVGSLVVITTLIVKDGVKAKGVGR